MVKDMPRFSTHLLPLAVVSITALAPSAYAQQQPPPPAGAYPPAPPPPAVAYPVPPRAPAVRSGWNFGFGLGGGDISCEGACEGVTEAGSLDLHVGYMVRPRLN